MDWWESPAVWFPQFTTLADLAQVEARAVALHEPQAADQAVASAADLLEWLRERRHRV